MEKHDKVVIFGLGAFAQVARVYLACDSPYEVVAFTVDRAYMNGEIAYGLPVVAFEELPTRYPPATHEFYAAIVYTSLNRLRSRLAFSAKQRGYALASYVSARAFLWHNVTLGEHCFVFEDNVLQPFVAIADNVVLWSGNHIGHHSRLGRNVFASSHVVVSGFCEIGQNSFLGVNSSVANNVKIGSDCWIGPGVAITQNTKDGELYRSPRPELSPVGARRFFRVDE